MDDVAMKTASETAKQAAASVPPGPQPRLRYEPKPKGLWKQVYGSAKDCDLSPEAFRLGARWRARMNRRGR